MGRSHVTPIIQDTEEDCGPASIKHTLAVFGKRRSLEYLYTLCKTSRNGTSTKNMIAALNHLGFYVLMVQKSNLKHLTSALRYSPNKPRAVIVNYLYLSHKESNWKESGHWATVSSYRSSDGRIVLFDSYTGHKKSYIWHDFKKVWKDYDLIRKRSGVKKIRYSYTKKWQHRLMLIVTDDPESIPNFDITTLKLFPPIGSHNTKTQ